MVFSLYCLYILSLFSEGLILYNEKAAHFACSFSPEKICFAPEKRRRCAAKKLYRYWVARRASLVAKARGSRRFASPQSNSQSPSLAGLPPSPAAMGCDLLASLRKSRPGSLGDEYTYRSSGEEQRSEKIEERATGAGASGNSW